MTGNVVGLGAPSACEGVAMKTIAAVYENGVFRPAEPVHLPEHARVRVEVENGNSDSSVVED